TRPPASHRTIQPPTSQTFRPQPKRDRRGVIDVCRLRENSSEPDRNEGKWLIPRSLVRKSNLRGVLRPPGVAVHAPRVFARSQPTVESDSRIRNLLNALIRFGNSDSSRVRNFGLARDRQSLTRQSKHPVGKGSASVPQ